MKHEINPSDLDGTYKYLIAASSGRIGTKRLFIVTGISDGEANTWFAVELKEERLFTVGNLRDAVEFYNEL